MQGIPHVVLIDPKGIVRWEDFQFFEGHELTSKGHSGHHFKI